MNDQPLKSIIYGLSTASFVVILDQLIKVSIRSSVAIGEQIHLAPGLDLTYTRNTGIAFGILAGSGTLIVVVGLIALVGLAIYLALRSSSVIAWISFGLLLGGAISNLADRVAYGAVTDYIDPVLWPAFNLADVAIVIGVFGVLIEGMQPKEPGLGDGDGR